MISLHQHLFKRLALNSAIAVAFVGGFPSIASAQPESARTLEEVTVTARRREESAQSTPVAVTALNTEALYRENITEVDDLMSSVPGVNFTKSGGADNTVFSIRGRSRGVFGNALPAVTVYVNEVPLSTWGGNVPSYDLASMQVLKGPQGTLFGRNSTAGAVLLTTERPSHEFSGYGTLKFGEYSQRVIEGALNIPLVEDVAALRISGQFAERDGYTEDVLRPNLEDYGNHDRDNFRVSLLLEPSDGLSNVTIFEQNDLDERALAGIPIQFDVANGAIAGVPFYNGTILIDPLLGPVPCNGNPICDASAMQARQEAAGIRQAFTDVAASLEQELTSWSNTTTLDLGSATLKNIVGYREVYTKSLTDIDGSQFAMINALSEVDIKQWTNEFQISGEAMDGNLEYIAGAFWLKSEPNGGNRLALQLFAQSGTPIDSLAPAPFNGAFGTGDFYTDTSKAAFGQVSYSLSDTLSVDLGLRHTEDEAERCSTALSSAAVAAPTKASCITFSSVESSKTSYNLGLNFELNDSTLLYGVARSGYRAGGTNAPTFVGALVPFQNYKPETMTDVELGIKSDWELGDVFGRFNMALFRGDYKDVHFANPTSSPEPVLIAITGAGVDGVDTDTSNNPTGNLFYVNAGDATVEGVEIEFVAQLTESLKVSLAGSYIDKSVDVDIEFPTTYAVLPDAFKPSDSDIEAFVFLAAPDWSYTASVDYAVPLDDDGELVFSANYFKISDVSYGSVITADSYAETDIRVDWFGAMGTSLDFAMYVSNLTNEEAIVAPSSSSPGLGFNSALFNEPRMWGASVRYSF